MTKCYLLTWNPENFKEGGDAGVKAGIPTRWSCHSQQPKIDDRIYLIRLGVEPRGIVASGTVVRESFADTDWRDPSKTKRYIEILPDETRSNPEQGMLPIAALKQLNAKLAIQFNWSPQSSGVEIPSAVATLLDAVWRSQEMPNMPAPSQLMTTPLNQIFFGPPGTGKTFVTIEAAVTAAEPGFVWKSREQLKARYDELVHAGRIRFVTFHQSYSYEDFVEGLAATSTDGKISYEKKLGVFRKLVNAAREYRTTEVRKASDSFSDCWQAFIQQLDESPAGVSIKTKRSQFVITEVEDNTIRFDKNQGNSVHTLALSTVQAVFEGQRMVHGGLQPYYDALIAHIRELGQQLSATEVVRQNYVLVIDEINRGNISRIFGELITLIEPSKRIGAPEALEVTLPLTGDKFGVPDNLYIIGTMNTADRSLAGLDLALRRRFTFVEMPPQPELLDDVDVEGVNIGAMLRVMNQRITALLDRDHCIGHAYFMPLCDNPSLPLLTDIFAQNILPLLQEYFFEDWQRIRWVLADQSKPADFAFIVSDEQMDAQQLFPNVPQFKSRECWRLNTAALQQAEAYRRIYQTAGPVTEQEA
ncbi:AAA family ATPase [Alkalimonas sp. MEB108]|uniref:AAA family ATPase n=1 Tax=Alkalimonas cellulosilytica TaxID=3058395 RepID=A0ABU7J0K6_9GAMM|nr:AAA family ATPase [Alkalimonas sp. MEB108]MEE2000029.1 AAA family ATPase [Alkalimonas sp. MEB108]